MNLCAIPWKEGGRSRETGVDCVGLAALFLREELGIEVAAPAGIRGCASEVVPDRFEEETLERGDLVFFRERSGSRICHVAVALGEWKFLNTLRGFDSRIENGMALLRRIGYVPVGSIKSSEAGKLAMALSDSNIGSAATIGLMIFSIALSVVSYAISPKPRLGQRKNDSGRYGFDALITQSSPELPLPIIYGKVTVAGNSPYQTLIDRRQTVTDLTQQRSNKVVILGSGRVVGPFTSGGDRLRINALEYDNPGLFDAASGPDGMVWNPAQTEAEAVTGTIGAETNRPSITFYPATHDITVPVDIRAWYDRSFPIYGFNDCNYLVFRLINSEKISSFNLAVTVKGRLCREYDANGFSLVTVSNQGFTGDGVKTRFLLDADHDVKEITTLTVGGVAYGPMGPGAQAGNVYQLNGYKGYVEFASAPANGAAILVSYKRYVRSWSDNGVTILIDLLTDKYSGLAMEESRIDWSRAVETRDYCDATITWHNSLGTYTGKRFTTNYVVDSRKPVQEHLRAILDSFYGYLFFSGERLVIKARKSEASVFSFNATNILEDSFESESMDRQELANRVKLFYHGSDTLHAEAEAVREDVNDQRDRINRAGLTGVVEETLKLPAVDTLQQAERLAEIVLREGLQGKWVAKFKTQTKGLAIEPGDVIDVTHPSQPAWSSKLFRVENIGHDEHDRIELTCSEYHAVVYI